jgi:hypothetical protein
MKHDHNEERSAAEKARIFLILTPSTARTDEIVHRLRHAAGIVDSASNQGFSSERVLNDIRREASTALKGVVASLELPASPLRRVVAIQSFRFARGVEQRRKSCAFLVVHCISPSLCHVLLVPNQVPKRRRRLRHGHCVMPTLKAYCDSNKSQRTTIVFRLGDALAQSRSVQRYVVFDRQSRHSAHL